jgi:hypothetical protein
MFFFYLQAACRASIKKITIINVTDEQSRGRADLAELNEVLAFDENSIRDHWLDSLVVMPEKFRIAT